MLIDIKSSRNKKAFTRATNRLHHHQKVKAGEFIAKHTTAEQRAEDEAKAREIGYKNYIKEMELQKSEQLADPEGYKQRKAKALKYMELLAEKRIKRLNKKIHVELSQKQKQIRDLNSFYESQAKRDAKKAIKEAKYSRKRKKVQAKPVLERKASISPKRKYIVHTSYIKPLPAGDAIGAFYCEENKVQEKAKYQFAKLMNSKEGKENIKKYAIYSEDEPTKCLLELTNPKCLTADKKVA